MKSFLNETLTFSYKKFWFSYILDLAILAWVLWILLQKFSWTFWMKEFWTLQNHVPYVTLLPSFHRDTFSIHWYIAQNFQHTFSLPVVSRRFFTAAMVSIFLKVALAMLYNEGFAPEFSVSLLRKSVHSLEVMYMKLQCSKLFHSKVSTGFLRRYLLGSCKLGKIHNVEELEISEGKF